MFKKILFLMLIFTTSVLVFANDDQGNPNNPNENDRANACYELGSMVGKCDTDWEWEAGWYLIRFEYGLISREDFPAQYAIMLPPLLEVVAAAASNISNTVGCQPVLGAYVNFGNSAFAAAGVPTFSDTSCSIPTGMTTGIAFVWTTSLPNAESICISKGFATANTVNPGELYHCS